MGYVHIFKNIHYKPSHHEPFDQALTRPDPDLIMISAIVNLDGIDGVPILAGLYLSSIVHHTKWSRAEVADNISAERCRKTVHLPPAMLARHALRVRLWGANVDSQMEIVADDPIRVGHPLPFRSVLCSSDKSKEAVWRIIVTLLVENKCEFKHQFWVKIIITCELLSCTQLFI